MGVICTHVATCLGGHIFVRFLYQHRDPSKLSIGIDERLCSSSNWRIACCIFEVRSRRLPDKDKEAVTEFHS